METNMLIALLLTFILLAGVRVYSLIGYDGAVHTAGPKAARAIQERHRLERKLGLHNATQESEPP
jgi:hypothetical protein